MRIEVKDDNGKDVYSYDTDPNTEKLFPARTDIPGIAKALSESLTFLIGHNSEEALKVANEADTEEPPAPDAATPVKGVTLTP